MGDCHPVLVFVNYLDLPLTTICIFTGIFAWFSGFDL